MRCSRCSILFVFLALVVLVLGFFSSADAASATLTWTDTSSNELGFEVERKPGLCAVAGIWAKIGDVGVNVATYQDLTPEVGYEYAYRVRAWNNTLVTGGVRQWSAYSNCAEASFPFAAPSAPGGLGAASTPQ